LSVLGSANDSTWTTLVGVSDLHLELLEQQRRHHHPAVGTSDRYVELDFTANNVQNGAQVSEFDVYGTSNPNLALNEPVTASSTTSGFPATNATDGNTSTYWEGTDGTWPSTLTVNLGSAKTLGQGRNRAPLHLAHPHPDPVGPGQHQ
jgi:microcystin-dependent protein